MQQRIRVRRERPSALSWAIALAVTMLAVYVVTLGIPDQSEAKEAASVAERITSEVVLEGMSVHFAALGSYPDAAEARVAAAAYAQRGAAGLVCRDGDVWRVLSAGYALAADAERIAGQLSQRENVETTALHFSAEAVTLRITAPESDIRAIESADRALREHLNQAASLALQVDRGELTPLSARTLASVSEAELRTALTALESIGGAKENPVCAGLIRLLTRMCIAFDEASGKASSAVLSGRLRLCYAEGSIALIEFLNTLSGGA